MAFLSVRTLKALLSSRSISSTTTGATPSKLFAKHMTPSCPIRLTVSPFSSISCIIELERTKKGCRMLSRNAHPYVIEGSRSSYYFEFDDESIQFRVDLPGVKKEGLKVWIKDEVDHEHEGCRIQGLFFEAEELLSRDEKHQLHGKESARKFEGIIPLVCGRKSVPGFTTDKVKLVLNNGVLKGRVPIAKLSD